jgi:hypothetical protein
MISGKKSVLIVCIGVLLNVGITSAQIYSDLDNKKICHIPITLDIPDVEVPAFQWTFFDGDRWQVLTFDNSSNTGNGVKPFLRIPVRSRYPVTYVTRTGEGRRRLGETETRRNDCFADEKIASHFVRDLRQRFLIKKNQPRL